LVIVWVIAGEIGEVVWEVDEVVHEERGGGLREGLSGEWVRMTRGPTMDKLTKRTEVSTAIEKMAGE